MITETRAVHNSGGSLKKDREQYHIIKRREERRREQANEFAKLLNEMMDGSNAK
jgi:hypothetical protein